MPDSLTSNRWEVMFSKLEKFKACNGHCLVPKSYVDREGIKLGVWVNTRRKEKNTMTDEHKKRFDAIGFEWDARATKWEEGFASLKKFKACYGHYRVPRSYIDEEKVRLGSWVNRQRVSKNTMSAQRRQQLDDIGFLWRVT